MKIDITFRDRTSSKLQLFKAKKENAPVVLCFPALGVRASFYKHFAQYLAGEGINAITADWRGFGESSVKISRKNNHGYKELIEDIDQILNQVNQKFPQSDKFILGHSLGGQLGALYASRFPKKLNGLILVASALVYYKKWGKKARQIQLVGNLFYPLSMLVGYFPGHILGFAGKEARGVMKDWCHNALTGRYEPANEDFDYEASLRQLELPVLSISLDKDQMAVRTACEALYGKFSPNCPVKHLHLTEEDTALRPLNHFAWAKNPEFVGHIVKEWING